MSHTSISRGRLRPALGTAAMTVLVAGNAFAQGRCRDGYGTQTCPLSMDVATAPIKDFPAYVQKLNEFVYHSGLIMKPIFQAAKESRGVYVFGSNADQVSLAPDRVVGSAVIDLPRAFLLVAEEVKAGTFRPRVEAFGLASGVVRYQPNPALDSLVPPALKVRVKAAADSIAAGTLLPAGRVVSMNRPSPP